MNRYKNRPIWKPITSCPEGIEVETCISDSKRGYRMIQKLTRRGNLFFADPDMYVYYTPTHWRHTLVAPSNHIPSL